ncbi:MAG: diguanylate cyclase [Gammaproteobacteria bacterium]|nr:diguanylate cyclase [Gammaproteobacteria bacterium]
MSQSIYASESSASIDDQLEKAYELWEDNQVEQALRLLEQVENELNQQSNQKPNQEARAILHNVRCRVLFSKGSYSQAITSNQTGLELPFINQFPIIKANLMLCHAQTLERTGEMNQALSLLDEVFLFAENSKLTKEKGTALYFKAQFLSDLGNSTDALKLLEQANTIFRSIDDAENIGNVLNAMANNLYYEKNYEKASEYYRELMELVSNDPFQLSMITFNLANSYLEQKKLDLATEYFTQSRQQSESIDDGPGVAYAIFGLAKVAFAQEDFKVSLEYLEKAKSIFQSFDMQNQVAQIHAYFGHNYRSVEQYSVAQNYYDLALTQYKKANIKPGIQAMNKALSGIYASQNNFRQAYDYLFEYNAQFEQQVLNNKEQALAKMQVLYDTEKKEVENQFLAKELQFQTDINEKVKLQERLKTGLLISFAITIVLMGFLIRKHIRHKEMFRRLSQTDELTQLNNRRQILNVARNCFELNERYQLPATVLIFDIDYFKHYNDQHGHDAGDLVLQKVANTALTALRKTDQIGRIGGEEFLVLLTNTSQKEAAEVAERLRVAIESMDMQKIDSTKPVTVSIGAVAFGSAYETLEQALKAADEALYTAKNAGRNCVKFA